MADKKIRWLVRDPDGKIYGPLSTERVLQQISAGFFRGEEDVSLYPNGKWISISVEPQFYDQLLDVLDSEIKSKSKQPEKPKDTPKEDVKEIKLGPEVSKTGEPPAGFERGKAHAEVQDHQADTYGGVETDEVVSRMDYEESEAEDDEEVIELTDVHQIEKREKVKASRLPLLVFAVLCIAIISLLFIKEDDSVKIRLLPTSDKKRDMNNQQVAVKFQKAIGFFELDTHNNYKRAQSELVQIVDSQTRVPDPYELLCMTYHYLWPFSYQDSKDINTIKTVVKKIKLINPTSRAAVVCTIVELLAVGRYQEASGLSSNTLRSFPQYVFVNQIYGELLAARKQYETAKYYFNQAKVLWNKKPPWLGPKVHEARMYTKIKGPDEQQYMSYAYRLYREVLKANNNHSVAKVELGKIEFDYFKHVDKGLSLVKDGLNGVERLPKSIEVDAFVTLAKIHKRRNERQIALEYAQRAFSINSSNRESKDLIVELGGMEKLRNTKMKDRELLYVGDQFVKAGDCFAAQAEFKAAFEVDSTNGIAAMKAAKCLWELNQSEEAIVWLKKAVQADPKLTTAYVLLADYFSQRFDYLNAVKVLKKIRRINPRSYEVYRGYALVQLRRRNFKGAVVSGSKALQLYETDVDTLLILARAYMGVEEYNDALKMISRAIELDNNNVDAHCIYAKVIAGLRGPSRGIDYLRNKINDYPKISAYREALGDIYRTEENFRMASDLYNQVVQLEPNNKKAFLKLGEIIQQESQSRSSINRALEIYLRAAALDPSDANPIFLTGKLYLDIRKYGLALKQFRRVIEINPRFPLAHFYAGQAALELQQYPEALEYSKAERNINPGLAESYLLAADAYFRLKQFQNCAEEYQKATSRSQLGSMVYVKLGRCYRLAGALDSAVSSLKLASVQESGNPLIYLEFGKVYEMQGSNDAAIEAFEKYLALAPNAPDKSRVTAKIRALAN